MTSRVLVGLLVLLGSLFILFAVSGETVGATWIVDDDNGSWADFNSIQIAIDNANPSDVIMVYQGEYECTININKSISLIGNGTDASIILGNESIAITVMADDSTIIGFKVESMISDESPLVKVVANGTEIANCSFIANEVGIFLKDSSDSRLSNISIYSKQLSLHFDNSHNNSNEFIGILNGAIKVDKSVGNILSNITYSGNPSWENGHIELFKSSNTLVTHLSCDNGIVLTESNENRIIDCIFSNGSMYGIELIESHHNIIKRNNCSNRKNYYDGIFIQSGNNNTIIENECIKNSNGISIGGTNNQYLWNVCNNNICYGIDGYYSPLKSLIVNNICDNNGYSGIRLCNSQTVLLVGNQFNGSVDGVHVRGSNNITLQMNIISNNSKSGILLESSTNISITNNTFFGIGIRIDAESLRHWATHDIVENTLNSYPILYYSGLSNIDVPRSFTQLIMVNCTESVISNITFIKGSNGVTLAHCKSIIIDNNTISCSNSDAIQLVSSNECVIKFNTCVNAINGIYLRNSRNADVFANVCQQNTNGMLLHFSKKNSIHDNIFQFNNDFGIYEDFYKKQYNYQNRFVSNSVSYNNISGVRIEKSVETELVMNTFSNNKICGILLRRPYKINVSRGFVHNNEMYGVRLFEARHSIISNVSIYDNKYIGVNSINSTYSTILNNIIHSHNSESKNRTRGVGIYLNGNSEDCLITSNILHDNTIGTLVDWNKDCRFQKNSLHSNNYGLFFANFSSGNNLNENNIYNNSLFGIDAHYNLQDVDATNNWWGDETGPYHPLTNVGGSGDDVSNFVDYSPWSENPFSLSLPNAPPVATILTIKPFPSHFGQNVTFTANASDGDGNVTRYVWSSDIDGVFYNGTENVTIYGALSEGEHNITLRVQDDRGAWSEPFTTAFTVIPDLNIPNIAPNASILLLNPDPATASWKVSFLGTGTDIDGIIKKVFWNSSVDGILYSGAPVWSFETSLTVELHNITLSVRDDDKAWSRTVWAYLPVHPRQNSSNIWPNASIESVTPEISRLEDEITLVSNSTDDDGTIELYVWISSINGLFYSGTNSTYTTTALKVGTHTIELRVRDDQNAWSNATVMDLTILEAENVKPYAYIVNIDPDPAYDDDTITFTGGGDDPDGDIVWYFWQSDLSGTLYDGENASFPVTGIITGTHTITLTVQDDDGTWSDQVSTTLTIRTRTVEPEDEERGIIDQITGLLKDPMMLILIVLMIVVIGAALGVRGRKRKKAVEENARKTAPMREPMPGQMFQRPESRMEQRLEEHNPTAGEQMLSPEEDTGLDWEPKPERRVDRYERDVYRQNEVKTAERGPARSFSDDLRRGEVVGYDEYGKPVYGGRITQDGGGPPPPRKKITRKPKRVREDKGFTYHDSKAYLRHSEPVKTPEVDKKSKCPDCDAVLEEDARFCPECGTYLK